jgi:hypothetical protein
VVLWPYLGLNVISFFLDSDGIITRTSCINLCHTIISPGSDISDDSLFSRCIHIKVL